MEPAQSNGESALHEDDHSLVDQQVEDTESGRHLADGRVGVTERSTVRAGGVIARCLAVGSPVEFAHHSRIYVKDFIDRTRKSR